MPPAPANPAAPPPGNGGQPLPLPRDIAARGEYYAAVPPVRENTLYGPLNSLLAFVFPPQLGFHIKPLYRLKTIASKKAGPTHARQDSSGTYYDIHGNSIIPDVAIYWCPNPNDHDPDQLPVVVIDAKRSNMYDPPKWKSWVKQMMNYVTYLNDDRQGGRRGEVSYKALRQLVPGILLCNNNAIQIWPHFSQSGSVKARVVPMGTQAGVGPVDNIYSSASEGYKLLWRLRTEWIAKYAPMKIDLPLAKDGVIPAWLNNYIQRRIERGIQYEASGHGPTNTRLLCQWPISKGYMVKPQPIFWKPAPITEDRTHAIRDSQVRFVLPKPARFPDFAVVKMHQPPGQRPKDRLILVSELKREDTAKAREEVAGQISTALEIVRQNNSGVEFLRRGLIHGLVILGMLAWAAGWKKVHEGGKDIWKLVGPDFTLPGVPINRPQDDPFWKSFMKPPQ